MTQNRLLASIVFKTGCFCEFARYIFLKTDEGFMDSFLKINHVSQYAFEVALAGGILLISEVWGVLN